VTPPAAAIDGQDRWPTDLIDIIVSDSERNTKLAVDAQQDAASNRLRAIIVLSRPAPGARHRGRRLGRPRHRPARSAR
jgi:hypothetical protein